MKYGFANFGIPNVFMLALNDFFVYNSFFFKGGEISPKFDPKKKWF
jgi:hypothetical protein